MKADYPLDSASLTFSFGSVIFANVSQYFTTSTVITILTILSLLSAVLYNAVKLYDWFQKNYRKRNIPLTDVKKEDKEDSGEVEE